MTQFTYGNYLVQKYKIETCNTKTPVSSSSISNAGIFALSFSISFRCFNQVFLRQSIEQCSLYPLPDDLDASHRETIGRMVGLEIRRTKTHPMSQVKTKHSNRYEVESGDV